MIKRVQIFFLLFLCFAAASYSTFFFESEYRRLVINFYKYSTNNRISFIGKGFHFFPTYKFSISFGLYILILVFSSINFKIKWKFLHLIIIILTFFISIFLLSYMDSNSKLIQCTACDDGKLAINYNQINYDLIFIVSLLTSVIPFLISRIIKKINK